jgi:hypothetical protein
MSQPTEHPIEERDLREIAALADGSLSGRRRDAMEARVRARPELAALLAEQETVVAALRAVEVAAPGRLRAALAQSQDVPRRSRRPVLGFGLAAAAAAAVAIVLVLPSGTPGAPSVVQAAGLGVRPATLAAPAVDPAHPGLLRRSLEGVTYPDWRPHFGWRAVGTRTDRLGGRSAVTVFYVNRAGERLAYTIVGGRALSRPRGAARLVHDGIVYRALSRDARHVVTWERGGHTCVLSAAGVRVAALVDLAGYRDDVARGIYEP